MHERVKQDGHCVVVEVAVGGAKKAPKTSRDKIRVSAKEVRCLAEMCPQNQVYCDCNLFTLSGNGRWEEEG